MASGLFEKLGKQKRAEGLAEGMTKGIAKGQAKGLAKGRAEGVRQICVDLAKAHHSAVAFRVVPVIEACSELPRLRRWALPAPRVSDAEFARLVTGRASSLPTRRRAPRPARRVRRGGSR